ncbi:MAG: hypothetical protein KGD63_12155 [Candidatus Lokiarchaeota archaeon]|nr:hypothetical protein [Candidatus Lokiarchaeota archaeon]
MIYFILFFQQKSGELLFSYSFQEEKKIEIFTSIISAIKKFTTQTFSSEKESLKNIQIGEYFVILSQIKEISSDLVFICDNEDEKSISKIIPEINYIALGYKEIFINLNSELQTIQQFTYKITKTITSISKLIPKNDIIITQEKINKELWNQKGLLISKLKESFLKEENELLNQYQDEDNFIIKLKILKKICSIKKKQGEEESFQKWNEELDKIGLKIKDQEIRLNHYLKEIKETLKNEDYKTIYPSLYSFCNKLQYFGKDNIIKKYKKIAEIFLDEKNTSVNDLNNAKEEILKMSFNLQDYYPN